MIQQMLLVRKTLTEILLEVTDEKIQEISKETLSKYRRKGICAIDHNFTEPISNKFNQKKLCKAHRRALNHTQRNMIKVSLGDANLVQKNCEKRKSLKRPRVGRESTSNCYFFIN